MRHVTQTCHACAVDPRRARAGGRGLEEEEVELLELAESVGCLSLEREGGWCVERLWSGEQVGDRKRWPCPRCIVTAPSAACGSCLAHGETTSVERAESIARWRVVVASSAALSPNHRDQFNSSKFEISTTSNLK